MPPKKFHGARAAAAAYAESAPTKKAKPAQPKTEGWTDEAWEDDCQRRSVEMVSRWKKDEKLKKKKAEAAAKKMKQEAARVQANFDGFLAPSRSSLPFPAHHAGSQGSISSPASYSPSSPAVMTPRPRFSPSPDNEGEQYGGFNPLLVFPHCPAPWGPPGFNLEAAYGGTHGGSPSYDIAPALHRGPLPFHPSQAASSSHAGNLFDGMSQVSQENYMANLITSGSDAAAASASFYTQEEARTGAEQGLESQNLEDGNEVEEVDGDEVEEVDLAKAKAKGKRKIKAKVESGPRIKWMHLEDECLAESWKEASLDTCVGAFQNSREVLEAHQDPVR